MLSVLNDDEIFSRKPNNGQNILKEIGRNCYRSMSSDKSHVPLMKRDVLRKTIYLPYRVLRSDALSEGRKMMAIDLLQITQL